MDQAQTLREYMHRFSAEQEVKEVKQSSHVITITSGKGGVGKTNFTLNFALGLKAIGKKVIVLDMDLSTANINILMGITPKFSLADVLHQKKHIWDIVEHGIDGINYIYGGLDLEELMDLDQPKLTHFWGQIQELQAYADYILLDTGAGISKELIDWILASDETILVTTPEPTSIADSYSVLKTVQHFMEDPPTIRLVVNRVQNFQEGLETARALQNATSNFLKMDLKTLGFLMEDTHVRQSVRSQAPFYISYPNCIATKNIKQIVAVYVPDNEHKTTGAAPKGMKGIFQKIISIGKWSK
ncbi:MinD/ParA family protein [Bacillus sp. DNRA2]|uniref:MinD/ParA family protein n=1 Tax=Bacillus sp. DNRA2 TaxID=2723053 RepID=UPI00145E4A47|nr:MinD/ParA family protein [Bacillus sp. DNRA2]NMD69105.1 MinD/ParA family protein [Bacillus sp. DNRA2]